MLAQGLREMLVHRERRCPPAAAMADATAALDRARLMSRLLEAKEVAELLAVPESWVRAETRAGRLPHVCLGRYRRYDEAAVFSWLEGQRAGQWRKYEPQQGRAHAAEGGAR